ncbi:hypothetical protein TcCL_NonESM13552, partial [Trypanosoma cruzi]
HASSSRLEKQSHSQLQPESTHAHMCLLRTITVSPQECVHHVHIPTLYPRVAFSMKATPPSPRFLASPSVLLFLHVHSTGACFTPFRKVASTAGASGSSVVAAVIAVAAVVVLLRSPRSRKTVSPAVAARHEDVDHVSSAY